MPSKITSTDSTPTKGSKVVYVQGLPPRADALFVYRAYLDCDETRDAVVEIYTTTRSEGGVAWVEFTTAEDAHDLIQRLHGQCHIDDHDETSKQLTVTMSKRAPPPKGLARLSDWRKEREEMVASRTVSVSNLNVVDIRSNLDKLLKLLEERNDDAEDPEDTFDIEHLEVTSSGTALVQFAAEYTAELAVDAFSGTYWQGSTVYIKFVPDDALDQYFATILKEKSASKKAEQLAAEIASIQEMQEMETSHAASSSPSVDGISTRLSSLDLVGEHVDVRIDNLTYAATKEDVKNAFAKKDLEVTKVVLKKGFAWVGLPSQYDANRAVKVMTGRRLRGRTLKVELASKE